MPVINNKKREEIEQKITQTLRTSGIVDTPETVKEITDYLFNLYTQTEELLNNQIQEIRGVQSRQVKAYNRENTELRTMVENQRQMIRELQDSKDDLRAKNIELTNRFKNKGVKQNDC